MGRKLTLMGRKLTLPLEAPHKREPRYSGSMTRSDVSTAFRINPDALEETFITAGGPGGQNVNKVATACQLRCDVFKLGLPPYAYQRLKELAGSRMTEAGEIVITARTHRTQEANREEARARLAELIAKAHIRQAKRIRTKPGRAAKARRLDEKKGRGAVKAARAKPRID